MNTQVKTPNNLDRLTANGWTGSVPRRWKHEWINKDESPHKAGSLHVVPSSMASSGSASVVHHNPFRKGQNHTVQHSLSHDGWTVKSDAAPKPPNYRPAAKRLNAPHCGSCKMFEHGKCWGYGNIQVKEDAVCDSYSPSAHKSAIEDWHTAAMIHPSDNSQQDQPDNLTNGRDQVDSTLSSFAGDLEWKLPVFDNLAAEPDELFVSLNVPKPTADEIFEWAKKQDWPKGTELENPSDYHITLIYSPKGHKEHKEAEWWATDNSDNIKVKDIDEFPSQERGELSAFVLRVDTSDDEIKHRMDRLLDEAESHGVEVNRYPGGSKPHITVAYGPKLPKGLEPPDISFSSDEAHCGEPRTSSLHDDVFSNSETNWSEEIVGQPHSYSHWEKETNREHTSQSELDKPENDEDWSDEVTHDSRIADYNVQVPVVTPNQGVGLASPAQVADLLSLQSVAHNLHYKFEQSGLDPTSAQQYASRLLQAIGYRNPDQPTIEAALQAWKTLYPSDAQSVYSLPGNAPHLLSRSDRHQPSLAIEGWRVKVAAWTCPLCHNEDNDECDCPKCGYNMHEAIPNVAPASYTAIGSIIDPMLSQQLDNGDEWRTIALSQPVGYEGTNDAIDNRQLNPSFLSSFKLQPYAVKHFNVSHTSILAKKPKVRKTEKPQKCKFCKDQATKSILWAEGKAYIPVCDKHEQKARKHVGEDEVCAVHTIKTAGSPQTIISPIRAIVDQSGQVHTFNDGHAPYSASNGIDPATNLAHLQVHQPSGEVEDLSGAHSPYEQQVADYLNSSTGEERYHARPNDFDWVFGSRTAMPFDPQFIGQLTPRDEAQGWEDREHDLYAQHPQHGDVGAIGYEDQGRYPGQQIAVRYLDTYPEHRHKGVASWLMEQLESKYPGASINHGERTPEGEGWAKNYYGVGPSTEDQPHVTQASAGGAEQKMAGFVWCDSHGTQHGGSGWIADEWERDEDDKHAEGEQSTAGGANPLSNHPRKSPIQAHARKGKSESGTPADELSHFLKVADSWDTRQWPDPISDYGPRPSVDQVKGCTCLNQQDSHAKLTCPVHGLDANGEYNTMEWSIPENSPVGYPQDQPRNWTQAVSKIGDQVHHNDDTKANSKTDQGAATQRTNNSAEGNEHEWHQVHDTSITQSQAPPQPALAHIEEDVKCRPSFREFPVDERLRQSIEISGSQNDMEWYSSPYSSLEQRDDVSHQKSSGPISDGTSEPGVTVEEVDAPRLPDEINRFWKGRQPLLYHVPTGRVLIGPQGSEHGSLYNHLEHTTPEWLPEEVHEGIIGKGGVKFFDDNSSNDEGYPQAAADAVVRHTGIAEDPEVNKDYGWNFNGSHLAGVQVVNVPGNQDFDFQGRVPLIAHGDTIYAGANGETHDALKARLGDRLQGVHPNDLAHGGMFVDSHSSEYGITPGSYEWFDTNFAPTGSGHNQAVEEEIRRRGLEPKNMDEQWNFSKVAGISVHEVGEPTESGTEWHGTRRPFTYFPNEQDLILGAPGADHAAMLYSDPRLFQKYRRKQHEDDTAAGGVYTDADGNKVVEYYYGTPEDEHVQAVQNALGAQRSQLNEWHVGDDVHDNPDCQWNFNSKKSSYGWQPGEPGKWSVFEPGELETWNVDLNGAPHHADIGYGEANGMIRPDGRIDFDRYPRGEQSRILQELMATHPELRPKGKQWDFNSKAAAGAQFHDIPEEDWQMPNQWSGRRPTFYDPESDTVHVGPMGTHHQDITDAAMGKQFAEGGSLGNFFDGAEGRHYEPIFGHDEQHQRAAELLNANLLPEWGITSAMRPIIPAHVAAGDEPTDDELKKIEDDMPQERQSLIPLDWEPGLHGKGIYWPLHNHIKTWGDARHHADVWMDDEHDHLQDPSYHFEISPEGVVESQGGFDKSDWDKEHPDIDNAELQHLLEVHHPDLVTKPSEYTWNFSKVAHQLGWQPGEYGKGLIHNGEVHTWSVGDYFDGDPTHPAYAVKNLGMPRDEAQYFDHPKHQEIFDSSFAIDPKGNVNIYEEKPEIINQVGQAVESADPRLNANVLHDYDWNFGPTEPMKTTPDSEDEKRLHNVEISNDWEVPTVDA